MNSKRLIESVAAGKDTVEAVNEVLTEQQEKMATVEVWKVGDKYEARLKPHGFKEVGEFGVKISHTALSGHSALAAMAKNWSNAGYLD